MLSPLMRKTRLKNLQVSDDIQEALECVREVRATNQVERYLEGIKRDIDASEKRTIKGELVTGICVNGSQIVLRLGLASTIVAGAALSSREAARLWCCFVSCWWCLVYMLLLIKR